MDHHHPVFGEILAVFMAAACAPGANDVRQGVSSTPASAGLDLAGMDRSIAPGDDFFAFANGTWRQSTEIPADRSTWGGNAAVAELTARRGAHLVQEGGDGRAAGRCAPRA